MREAMRVKIENDVAKRSIMDGRVLTNVNARLLAEGLPNITGTEMSKLRNRKGYKDIMQVYMESSRSNEDKTLADLVDFTLHALQTKSTKTKTKTRGGRKRKSSMFKIINKTLKSLF